MNQPMPMRAKTIKDVLKKPKDCDRSKTYLGYIAMEILNNPSANFYDKVIVIREIYENPEDYFNKDHVEEGICERSMRVNNGW